MIVIVTMIAKLAILSMKFFCINSAIMNKTLPVRFDLGCLLNIVEA